ncbi:MAG TPA: hypothetical protein VF384_17040 [Planctomycetota bacterium]
MAIRKNRFAALNISLPKQLRSYVEQRVRRGGFGNVSEYIRVLIRHDQAAPAPAPAATAPAAAVPGVDAPWQSPPPPAVRETSEPTGVVDFSTEDWRELRAALHRGGQLLMNKRARDIAALFRTALESTRIRLRREDPRADEGTITMRVVAWLHEQEVPADHPWQPVSRERWRRITGE